LNRDGWPDVAHANIGRNSVTILLNQAGAGLARVADVAVGAGPFDLTTGDFDRDGIPDLAVANADGNSISVLRGRGDPHFTRSDVAAPSQNPRGITTADVNRDGKADLIYSDYVGGRVQVLVGNGAGAFTTGITYASAALRPQGIATADFNHDGHLDVAVAYASGAGLRLLSGNGGSAFNARAVAGAVNLNVVEVGDFNRDGWVDVAAASTAGSTVAVYRGSATGLVHTQTLVVGASPRGIAIADANNDGMLDIVTANRASSTVSVLLGDRAHPGAFLEHGDVAAGTGSRDVVVADFDADGRLDIASGNEYAASVTVLSNNTFFAPAAYALRHVTTGGATITAPFSDVVASADFNHDGRMDLATHGADFETVVILLTSGPAISLPVSGSLIALAVADVNGDGNSDVLYAAAGPDANAIGSYFGDGRGAFVKGPSASWIGVTSLAVGDVNRDGRPDLVSANRDLATGSWILQVGLGRGDGTFALSPTRVTLPDSPRGLALADVNRDGQLDAVVLLSGIARGQPMEVRAWFGNGGGGLAATSWNARFITTFGVQFGVADVNQDGYLDLVAAEFQQMGVALGSATGFSAPVYTPVTSEDQFLGAVATGDLNVDGHLDVTFGSGDVMFGNGDGTFVAGGRFDYGDASSVRVADFTPDGLPDIVASTDRGITVLANTRGDTNQAPTVDAGPDRTVAFGETQGEDCGVSVTAAALDPDAHALTYGWRRDGMVVSTAPTLFFCGPPPGSYVNSVTVRDGRGGVATDSVAMTIQSIPEIVLWAADASFDGRWTLVPDQTAAGGVRVYDPNLGAPKVTTPSAEPTTSTITLRFFADPTLTYKLWIRLKADRNSYANDSIWVQFWGATDLAGVPSYQIGTNSGLAVNLEECSGCGVSGWGWEDNGWGAPNRNGVLLRFPQTPDRDPQSIVIQTREDGVSIDQVVLSAARYATARPGAAKNDTTILPSTQPPR
jgi:hypothetical protein